MKKLGYHAVRQQQNRQNQSPLNSKHHQLLTNQSSSKLQRFINPQMSESDLNLHRSTRETQQTQENASSITSILDLQDKSIFQQQQLQQSIQNSQSIMHGSNINDTFGNQINLMESIDKIVMIDSKSVNLLQSAQSDNILEDEISKQQEELFLINQRIQKLHDKKQKRLEKKQRIENIFINLQQKQTAASILKRYDIKDPTQFLDSSQDYAQRNLTFRPQISQASIEILKTSRNVTPNGKSRTKSKQKNLVEKLHKEYVKRRQSIELQCIHQKMQEEELEMKECTFTPKLSRNSRDLLQLEVLKYFYLNCLQLAQDPQEKHQMLKIFTNSKNCGISRSNKNCMKFKQITNKNSLFIPKYHIQKTGYSHINNSIINQ